MPDARRLSVSLPTFDDLLAALPEEWQAEARHELLDAYRCELHSLIETALGPACQEPRVVMRPWRQAGRQLVCEFWVADAAVPWTPASNLHGQNVSQWRYGGAIVAEGGRITRHH